MPRLFSLYSWAVRPREGRAVFPGPPAAHWGPGTSQSLPALTEPAGVWGLVQSRLGPSSLPLAGLGTPSPTPSLDCGSSPDPWGGSTLLWVSLVLPRQPPSYPLCCFLHSWARGWCDGKTMVLMYSRAPLSCLSFPACSSQCFLAPCLLFLHHALLLRVPSSDRAPVSAGEKHTVWFDALASSTCEEGSRCL